MRSKEQKSEGPEQNRPADGGSAAPHSSLLTPHCIRLGPPWQLTATDGGTHHTRKFGCPRTLDANERLWLVCEIVPGAAEVHLNGTLLGTLPAPGPFAADITSLLRPRNEVVFSVTSDTPLAGVRLEIRPA